MGKTDSTTTIVDHLIIGAGFSGLGAAIKLQEDGERDFVVIERGADVGGTWRDNTYPGAACDVPSHLYSFSFAPNPEWTSSYSPQPEIQAYLQDVAQRSGTLDRFVFDTTVQGAEWDEQAKRWEVTTTAGTWSARTLVVGAGGLSTPKMPDIEGLDTFQGEVFHSAQWNHDADLTGKRIGVIGTGASAIQIVPELQKIAELVAVFQRTAPWVMPRHARRFKTLEKQAMRHVPGVRHLYRANVFVRNEIRTPAFTMWPKLLDLASGAAIAHMKKAIKDPELRAKATPDYTMGCKRVLVSDDYYPAIAQDNVDLITEPISKVTGSGITTAEGTEHEFDVLVVATGFFTTELPMSQHVIGKHGQSLSQQWRESGMTAYKGTTVPNFPNMFMIPGPNVGLGHTSMVLMIEAQIAYLRKALAEMRRRGYSTVEVSQRACDAYNEDLQNRMKRTVWSTGGCDSWYLDDHGKNTTLWPRTTLDFRRRLSRFDSGAYLTTDRDTAAVPEEISA